MNSALRLAEQIQLAYSALFLGLAWFRGLNGKKRKRATAFGGIGIAVTLFAALVLPRVLPPPAATAFRDWLPAGLILVAYHQAGLFFERPDERLQAWLDRLDRAYVTPLVAWLGRSPHGPWLLGYLELSYVLCYATVPAGIGAIYLLNLVPEASFYWGMALSASYLCYGMLPWFQTLPPRSLTSKELPAFFARNPIRRFNLWILGWGSIHVNTFPSAHVAASFAVGLALLRIAPVTGAVFLWVAFSIAAGAVIGRYHYFADAIAGVIVAVAAWAFAILTQT